MSDRAQSPVFFLMEDAALAEAVAGAALAAVVAPAAAFLRLSPLPMVWSKNCGENKGQSNGKGGRRKTMQRKRRRKQMASEDKFLSPPALFTAIGLQIATVQNGFRAQRHIWPYTWRHKRAIIAGHSAHYAR